ALHRHAGANRREGRSLSADRVTSAHEPCRSRRPLNCKSFATDLRMICNCTISWLCRSPEFLMPRLFLLLLALAPLMALPVVAADRLKAVTSFTILADMARNVAGDAADVVSITRPGAGIHNYQPTPGDLVGAQD